MKKKRKTARRGGFAKIKKQAPQGVANFCDPLRGQILFWKTQRFSCLSTISTISLMRSRSSVL